MANTYKALQTVTVGSGGTSSINFTNIPQTYTDLQLVISARDNDPGHGSAYNIALNGTNWGSNKELYVYNGTPGYGTTAGETSGTGAGATVSTFGNASVYIPNYVSSNSKTLSSDSVAENNSTTNYYLAFHTANSGITEPITSISIAPGGALFSQYSTATLYGIFNADVSSAPATPTIGTATAGASQASITFTPVSNAASYTMTSTPSSITATGTTSPIVVTGLTNGTAYTFKVKSNNPFGSSAESAASNSITPVKADFESIATASGGNSSVTFSNIPSTYKHLQLRIYARNDGLSGPRDIRVRFNGDGNSNYRWHSLRASGTTISASNGTGVDLEGYLYFGMTPSQNNGNQTTVYSAGIFDIHDYSSTSKTKTVRGYQGYQANNSTGYVFYLDGHWNSTSAISSIFIESQAGSFTGVSSIALYGIKE